MHFDELKRYAIVILKNYERSWQENEALRVMIRSYPMLDGTTGIPEWEQRLERWLSEEASQALARKRFSALFAQLEQSHSESEVLELLAMPPASGRVQ